MTTINKHSWSHDESGNTREVDLYMPAADGFGLPTCSATIEVDPIDRRMIGLVAHVEKGRGASADSREIDCLAGSDNLPFEDKPVAALVETLALHWLSGSDGQEWFDSLQPTTRNLRAIAEHRNQSASSDEVA